MAAQGLGERLRTHSGRGPAAEAARAPALSRADVLPCSRGQTGPRRSSLNSKAITG